MTLPRGKSIVMKPMCALNWFESHANTQLNSTAVEVRDYVSGFIVRDSNGLPRKVAH